MMTTEQPRALPIKTILSGPAGGVSGGRASSARAAGDRNLITYDMGGTSDRRLPRSRDWTPRMTTERHGRRAAGQGAADRHQHGRRRRRQHRRGSTPAAPCKSGRAAPAPARARLLRARRHRADGHRRQRRARPPRHRRGRSAARSASTARGRAAAVGALAGAARPGRGRRWPRASCASRSRR